MGYTKSEFGIKRVIVGLFALLLWVAFPALAQAQSADILISNQTDSPDPSPAGGIVTYTILVSNNGGPNQATGVTLIDTLPAGATFVSATTTSGSCGTPSGGVLSCSLGTIAVNASATVTVQVRIPTEGVATNAVGVIANETDPNGSNNSDSEITTIVKAADMTLTVAAPPSVNAGQAYNYTVTPRNNGPDGLLSTDTQTISFTVPNGSCVTGTPTPTGTWSCTPNSGYPLCNTGSNPTISCTRTGALASGASAPPLIVPAVANISGTVTAAFSVSSSMPDGDPNNNTATVNTTVSGDSSDVAITKTASPTTVAVGSNVTYTLTPRFNGGTPPGTTAPNLITVTDTLGPGLTYVSATGTGWTCSVNGSTITCTRPGPYTGGNFTNMPTISVVGTATATGTLSNTVGISAPETDPNTSNNNSGVNVTGSNDADLRMTKTASINPVVPNQAFSYSLTVRNLGPLNIPAGQTITVTDTLPAGLNLTGIPSATGWTCTPNSGFPIAGSVTIRCTRSGPLAINTNAATISVPVVATTTSTITNNACVGLSGTGPVDPTSSNDCAGVRISSTTTKADLEVTSKTASPSPVDAGQDLTYVINVKNNGPDSSTNVTVTDTLSSLIATGGFQSAIPSQGTCTPSGVTNATSVDLSCNLGTLTNGGTASITVIIRPSIATTGTRTNTATVTSPDVGDPDRSNNSKTVTSTITAIADVTVGKTANPSPVQAGTSLTYVITAKNAGPSTASSVSITDTLPSNAAFVSVSTPTGSGTCGTVPAVNAVGGTLICTWPSLTGSGTGSQQTVQVVVRPLTSAAGSSVKNDVTIATTTKESNSTNNDATVTTPVTTASVDLLISKVDSVDPIALGQSTQYTISIRNNGPSYATDVALADTFPDGGTSTATFSYQGGLTFTPAGAGTCATEPAIGATTGPLKCTFPGIANGQTVTVKYNMKAESINTAGAISGTTFNKAVTTATEPETLTANNTATQPTSTRVPADLALTKSGPTTLTPGQAFDWTLNVTNNGPYASTGAVVTDVLPAGVTYQSAPGCTYTAATRTVSCTLGTLAVGGSTSLTIKVVPSSPYTGASPLVNTASVATVNEIDTVSTNNSGSSTTTIGSPVADLSIVKSSNPDPYVPGQTLTYTVVVNNAGPSNVVNGRVTDTLPAALIGFGWTCTATTGSSCTASGSGNISDTVNVRAGGSLTYTITGTVPSGTTGQLRNTATVNPPTGTTDPTPGNNTAVNDNPSNIKVDLSAVKRSTPKPYVPGQMLTYTVEIRNAGPSDAVNALVSDPLSAALAGFNWTCVASTNSSCTASGSGNITDTVTVRAGGLLTYTIKGTVPSGTTGELSNTVTVTPASGTNETNANNNSATDKNSSDIRADLSVLKNSNPDPYVPGQTLTYTVVVSNAGPSDAVGATVKDTLPAALAGFGWTCTATAGSRCTASGSGNISDTVNVRAGGSLTYTITGTVPSGTTGQLRNTATVNPPTGTTDPTPGNNTAVNDNPSNIKVDLSAAKRGTPNPYVPGQTLTYTVEIRNAGPSDAVNALVSDPLPTAFAGFTWTCSASAGSSCAASGSGGITDTVTVRAGGLLTYTIKGAVPAGLRGDQTNSVTVTPASGTNDTNLANNTATVVNGSGPIADLSVMKNSRPDPYVPGQTLTYTVVVSNAGPSDAMGATVTDTLPTIFSGFTWTCSASAGSSCAASGAGNINDTVNVLAGGKLTYTLSGTVPAGTTGVQQNTAAVNAPTGTTDPTPSNNSVTNQNPSKVTVDLSAAKRSQPTNYVPGQLLTYTVEIRNTGPSDAISALVSDPLPTEFAGFNWTCTASTGSRCAPSGTGPITDTVNVLAGGLLTYTISGTVPSSVSGVKTNSVTVTPPSGANDTNLANNTASVSSSSDARADLSVIKSSSPDPYVPGQPLTYMVVVNNAGPSDAVGATVKDTLPAALAGFGWKCVASTGSSCTASGTASSSGNISDTVNVRAGGSLTYTITGTVPSGTTGQLRNTATVNPPTGTTDPTPGNNTAANDNPSNIKVDLSAAKRSSPNPYVPGRPLTYTVEVSNAGPSDAVNALVSDPLPTAFAGFTWTCSASAGSSCAASGSGGITDTVTVRAGGLLTYTIQGVVPSGTTGVQTNTVTVTPPAGANEVNPNNNSANDTNPTSARADLSVIKSSSPDPYVSGQPLTYTVVVSNAGPSDAVGATVTDTLPVPFAGFAWTCTASSGSRCTPSGTGNINDTVNLVAGGSLTYTLSGTVPAGTTGVQRNTAAVNAPTGVTDPISSNNTAVNENPSINKVDLSATKRSSPNPYKPGQLLTYTVDIRNAGPGDAVNALVSDPLPTAFASFTWTCVAGSGSRCTASGSGGIADTVTVPAGGLITYTISGVVPQGTSGVQTNTVTVSPPSGVNDTNPGNNAASNDNPTGSQADLSIHKSSSPDPYVPGQGLTYTVVVSNAGPNDVVGGKVTDTLPAAFAGFNWICSASAGSRCTGSGSGNLNDTVDVRAGGTLTYTFKGTVPSGTSGSQRNTATVTPPAGISDPTPLNNTVVNDNPSASKVDLSVDKRSSPNPYIPGQRLTYTVEVRNAGPSDAVNALVSDPLPSALAKADFGWTCRSSLGSRCAVSGRGDINDTVTLLAGGILTYTVSGTVPIETRGVQTNTVTVSAPAGVNDEGARNNVASSSTDSMDPTAIPTLSQWAMLLLLTSLLLLAWRVLELRAASAKGHR